VADGEDRSEPASGKRIAKARSEGRVLRSQEVTSAVLLMASAAMLAAWGPYAGRMLLDLAWRIDGNAHAVDLTAGHVVGYFRAGTKFLAVLLGPVSLALFVAGIAVSVAQVGFNFTWTPLVPSAEKINPMSGLKRMFSSRAAIDLLKAALKIVAIGLVAVLTIRGQLPTLQNLSSMEPEQHLPIVGGVILQLFWRVVVAFSFLAAADYLVQRWQFQRDLRMTKQEVREEAKQSEGDPHIKGRVRSLMRQLSRRRMMADVPKADVIVTNPVHVAVALRYDPAEGGAPIVVAKGMRKIAEKIKELARVGGVPIVENPPLARELHRVAEVGEPIPTSLYKAVAEVLAFVYRLRGRARE
jgi:flagellar biosynthetic protein FlhB